MSDMSIFTSPILVLLVLFLLVRIVLGQLKEKSRKVSTMWIMPALMLYISYAAIEQGIFSTFYAPLLLLPAIIIGCVIGLIRGTRVSVRLGEASGTIMVKGSIFSLMIWGTMIAIRFLARYAIGSVADTSTAAAVVCALIVLSLSNTMFYYGYLYVRYYNLLKTDEAKDYNIL